MPNSSLSPKRSRLPALALFALAGLIFIGMFWYSTLGGPQPGPDFCAGLPSGILAIGVDATDTLSEAQRLDIRNHLANEIASVPSNWRVEMWNISPTSGVPTKTGPALCKPEKNVSSLTANPKRAAERAAQFDRSIDAALNNLLSESASQESPILEYIQAVGLRSFSTVSSTTPKKCRLILVSDLLQNTHAVSFVKSVVPFEEFKREKAFDTVRAPIAGAEVHILFLSRPNSLSAAALVSWWRQYFGEVGATLESVERVVG